MRWFFEKLTIILTTLDWWSRVFVRFWHPFKKNWITILATPFIIFFINFIIIIYFIIFFINLFFIFMKNKLKIKKNQIKQWLPKTESKKDWIISFITFYFFKLPQIKAYIFLTRSNQNFNFKKNIFIIFYILFNFIFSQLLGFPLIILRISRIIIIDIGLALNEVNFWQSLLGNFVSTFLENYQKTYQDLNQINEEHNNI